MEPKILPVDTISGTIDSKIGTKNHPERSVLTRQTLFGSAGRTDLLAIIAGLGRSFPRELARLVKLPMTTVVRNLDDLERTGALVSVRLGGTREMRLNPDYIVAKELRELLEALVEREPRYREIIAEAARRRPRRSNKPV